MSNLSVPLVLTRTRTHYSYLLCCHTYAVGLPERSTAVRLRHSARSSPLYERSIASSITEDNLQNKPPLCLHVPQSRSMVGSRLRSTLPGHTFVAVHKRLHSRYNLRQYQYNIPYAGRRHRSEAPTKERNTWRPAAASPHCVSPCPSSLPNAKKMYSDFQLEAGRVKRRMTDAVEDRQGYIHPNHVTYMERAKRSKKITTK